MIPTAELAAEYVMSNPPRLLGFHVIVDGKVVAVLSPEEVATTVRLARDHGSLLFDNV